MAVLFALFALVMTISIGPKSGLPMGNVIEGNMEFSLQFVA